MASHFATDTGSRSRGPQRGARPRRGLSTGKKVGIVAGIVLAVLLVVGGTSGFLLYRSAMTVKAEASELMEQVDPMKEALKSGDSETLDATVGTVQEKMAAVNAEVHTPIWTLASYIPVVGEDVRSVQALGEAGSALVNDALVPVASSLSGAGLDTLLQDGVVNVDLIRSIADAVSGAIPTIQSSVETISSLPEAHIPQLREILSKVQEPLDSASGLVDQIEPVLQLIPQMLGGDGARTYLVLAQNNAELRSTGGLPGSWGTITIDNGVISMGEFRTILHEEGLSVDITEEEVLSIATNMNTDPAQVNCTPDFVRVGELARDYWSQMGLGEVDGVIAIDPVFLQSLLTLTGGFTAPDGATVDGTNAAKVLLSDTYWKFGNDNDAQDEYFSSVAALAFQHVMDNLGNAGMTDLWDLVNKGAEQGRLLVWMADESEEALMEQLGFSGSLGSDPTTPELGVYLSDDTFSKISWYAQCYTTVGEGVKNADGTTTYDVTTVLANTITPEEAAAAPLYIYGGNPDKRDNSDMLDFVYLVGPVGGRIDNVQVSENALRQEYGVSDSTLTGHQVHRFRTHLLAGETATITYQVTVSAEAAEPLTVRTTPLAQESLMQAPAA